MEATQPPQDVLAVANHKGGAGKTTTAVSVAVALAAAGRDTTLVDLDPQCSATRWLAAHPVDEGLTRVLAGVARLADLAATTDHQRLLLVPGDPHLANADRALGRAALPQLRLRAALTRAHPHGLVLLDCPPSLGLVAVNALAAARAVLIPVAAQAMELDGLAALHETLAEVRSGLDHPVFVLGILACRVRPTRLGRDVVATLRAEHASLVLDTVIRENVRVAEAYAWRQPVSVYAPHSASAVDYRAATEEIAARLRK